MSKYVTWEEKLFNDFAMPSMPYMSVRKVGGLWFWKIGRMGGSFYKRMK